jgi:ABC-type nickel/cobalt efflux system permease component RcnA
MIALLTGLFAGFLHVLAGPDHLAAVAPFSADTGSRSWMTGLRWGIGHASGVVLVGMLCLVFRDLLPLESMSLWAERAIGAVLVVVGIWGIRRALTFHEHAHGHGDKTHTHLHIHWPTNDRKHRHSHAALAIGTLHGMAGSSHLFGILPALAFPTVGGAAVYLASFGVGSVVAMVMFSGMLGFVARNCWSRGPRMYRACMLTCSVGAVVVGGWWLMTSRGGGVI